MSALVAARSDESALTFALWAVEALRNRDPLAASLLRFAAEAAEAGTRARTAEAAAVDAAERVSVKPSQPTVQARRYAKHAEGRVAA